MWDEARLRAACRSSSVPISVRVARPTIPTLPRRAHAGPQHPSRLPAPWSSRLPAPWSSRLCGFSSSPLHLHARCPGLSRQTLLLKLNLFFQHLLRHPSGSWGHSHIPEPRHCVQLSALSLTPGSQPPGPAGHTAPSPQDPAQSQAPLCF